MENKEYSLSGNSIKKLGEKIKKCLSIGSKIESDDLLHLQQYRNTFKNSLAEVFSVLSIESRKIRKSRIVSYRIKRIETIINKLKRIDTMYLSTMQDIAGCRCIVDTEEQAYKILDAIKNSSLTIKKNGFKDYIKSPPPDGYKAIHLIVKSSENKQVEIQIRARKHHDWATLVEIIDILYNVKIKEGGKHPKLERFLFLFSNRYSLVTSSIDEMIKLEKELNIFEKISSTFSKNYLKIRKLWLNIDGNKDFEYFILEVDKSAKPLILPFTKFEEAEVEYFRRFDNDETNTVLTHVEKVNFKLLNIAYSNYTLHSHSFQSDWFEIISNMIDFKISKNNYKETKNLFNYYKDLNKFQQLSFNNEFVDLRNEIDIQLEKSLSSDEVFNNNKIKEWINNVTDQLTYRDEKTNEIQIKVKKSLSIKNRLNKMFGKK